MAKKSNIKINLSRIVNLQYAMQNCNNVVQERLRVVMEHWASETKIDYDAKSGYGYGLRGKKSYYLIENSHKTNGLYVAVGHASFIARFLEVGTKAHTIRHKQGSKIVVANVKGIKGSKALSKAFNDRRKKIAERIQNEINNILKGGI